MSLKSFICMMGIVLTVSCMSNNPVLSPQALRRSFEGAKPYSDVSSAFFSIRGLELLAIKH